MDTAIIVMKLYSKHTCLDLLYGLNKNGLEELQVTTLHYSR